MSKINKEKAILYFLDNKIRTENKREKKIYPLNKNINEILSKTKLYFRISNLSKNYPTTDTWQLNK